MNKKILGNIIIIIIIITVIITTITITKHVHIAETHDNLLTVKEIIDNNETLINTFKIIELKAYYNYFDKNMGEITDTTDQMNKTTNERLYIINSNRTLIDGIRYHFKGIIQEYKPIHSNLRLLIISEIK